MTTPWFAGTTRTVMADALPKPDLSCITEADLIGSSGDALLALNNAHAIELSWLGPDRFRHLVTQAFLAHRIGTAEAMLVAFDQDADYDSPNFLWFRSRFDRFVYVDRVVVAPAARGRGHARRLYNGLFARAARFGHSRVACEVNIDPPNPASHAFHGALGFTEVGIGSVCSDKTVRYLVREIGA